MHIWARRANFETWANSIAPDEEPSVLGHRNFIKSGMHCSVKRLFQKSFSRIDHNDGRLRQGAQCPLFIVLVYLKVSRCTHFTLYRPSHIILLRKYVYQLGSH